jgi:hypothetical protein
VRREISEGGANKEFEIAINGPNISHCDSVNKETMDDYLSALPQCICGLTPELQLGFQSLG